MWLWRTASDLTHRAECVDTSGYFLSPSGGKFERPSERRGETIRNMARNRLLASFFFSFNFEHKLVSCSSYLRFFRRGLNNQIWLLSCMLWNIDILDVSSREADLQIDNPINYSAFPPLTRVARLSKAYYSWLYLRMVFSITGTIANFIQ